MTQALLIVDIQHGLFVDQPAHDIDGVIGRINTLARRARTTGMPVIFVQHEAPGELDPGSPAWELDHRLQVAASDLRVSKTTSAPYGSSNLQQLLDDRGVKQVVVTGYATEFCIDSTVRWSASLGYDVTLVSDAHTTHDKPHLSGAAIVGHHNATLPSMDSLGGRVQAMPAASVWTTA